MPQGGTCSALGRGCSNAGRQQPPFVNLCLHPWLAYILGAYKVRPNELAGIDSAEELAGKDFDK
jgi:hypothetical protein